MALVTLLCLKSTKIVPAAFELHDVALDLFLSKPRMLAACFNTEAAQILEF
jgi:hypothetical protein